MEFFVVLTAVLAVAIAVFVSVGVGLLSFVVPAISSNFTRVSAAVGLFGVRASWRFPLLPGSRCRLDEIVAVRVIEIAPRNSPQRRRDVHAEVNEMFARRNLTKQSEMIIGPGPAVRLDLTNDRVFKFSTNDATACAQALEMVRRHPRS